MSRSEIEDGMGFAGLVPSKAERYQERNERRQVETITALRARVAALEAALQEMLECPLPGRMQSGLERTKANTNHQAVCHRARALLKAQS